MADELFELNRIVTAAKRAEDVFGELAGDLDTRLAGLKKRFYAMVQIAHPDHCAGEQAMAERTFHLLLRWHAEAESRIRAGLYGSDSHNPVMVRGLKATYWLHGCPAGGDYSLSYRCTEAMDTVDLVFKIARTPPDNVFVQHEIKTLRHLEHAARRAGGAYFPRVLDALVIDDGRARRQAVVFAAQGATYTAEEIRNAHPGGLDPRDAAWIFNRLLEGLWHTHRAGRVHGATVPANLLVDVANHGLVLSEWGYSIATGGRLRAISSRHERWYPPEVFGRGAATQATDVAMAARCLVHLLGGEPVSGSLPASVPGPLQRFIAGCLLPSPSHRPHDAGALREEFDELLKGLYGARKFRPLVMHA